MNRVVARSSAIVVILSPLSLVFASILACTTPQKAKLQQREKRLQFVNNQNVEEPYRQAILDKKIMTGMTQDQVCVAWNIPRPVGEDVTEFVSAFGRTTTWTVQPNMWASQKYILTFHDGRLESWYSYE